MEKREIYHTLGIIYADNAKNGLTHDFFSAILNGFKNEAESLGYEIHFINTNKECKTRKSYLDTVYEKNIDGVIVACINYDDPEVIELLQSDIPIITIDESLDGVVSVLSDNEQGMRELVQYIASMGHKKIAYIHGDSNTVTGKRLAVFNATCKELGIDIPAEYIGESNFRDVGRAAYLTEEMLRLPEPPTCIIYSDDYAATGGINIIHARGLTIPADISVAGYDGLDFPSRYEPRITTVKQNMDLMGKTAAQKLIEFIEVGKPDDATNIYIATSLSKGRTIRQVLS